MSLLSTFSKKNWKTIGVSNGLEPNQDILSVGPGKGAHCLHFRLSADGNRRRLQGNNTDLNRQQNNRKM